MSTALDDLHLGVGVAAHEHDAHLARTLEAIDALLLEAGVLPVAKVVAASDGSTAAEKIAAAHGCAFRRISPGVPRTLAAARETARRACGGDAQLLVDGDVAVQPGWLAAAVALLREHERLAGVSGSRRSATAASSQPGWTATSPSTRSCASPRLWRRKDQP